MKLELYLIRHGKTLCNENKLYCGSSNVSLSENGIKELLKLKNQLKYPKCEKYFTSGLNRANETFKILYEEEFFEVREDFKEYNFGDFEMKSYEMLKSNVEYISWITDEVGAVFCPNGESKSIYKERIKEGFNKFLKEVFDSNIKSSLIISHGGTIGTILEQFYDDSKSFYEHQPSCGRGYKLIIAKNNNKFTVEKVESF